MIRAEYFSFFHSVYDEKPVSDLLNDLAKDGWTLRDSTVITARGGEGIDSVNYAIIMERIYTDDEVAENQETGGSEDDEIDAMACSP